ncbi:MAG: DUF1292 domain-containing protein [Lachnospiraceae bacterium]|nr:DUF1292 domain-containing protein [Lachnospiraceae bacterium]
MANNMNPDDTEEIIVNLELEDGSEIECQVICIFEYGDDNYAALTPTDDSIEEIYFFGLEMQDLGEETEFTLSNIEDDDLLDELADVFDELMDEDDGEWDEFINKKLD